MLLEFLGIKRIFYGCFVVWLYRDKEYGDFLLFIFLL